MIDEFKFKVIEKFAVLNLQERTTTKRSITGYFKLYPIQFGLLALIVLYER